MTTALIYAKSLAKFKVAFPNWQVVDADGYRSITLTDDGYLISHGKVFKQAITDADGQISNTITVNSDGSLSISVGGNSASSITNLVNAASTSGISVTASDKGFALSHKTFTSGDTDTTVVSSINNYVLKLTTAKFDPTYGHYVGQSIQSTGTHLDYVAQTLATSGSYYLLGSASNAATTGAAVKRANVYVAGDTGTLYVPAINISGGVASIIIGSTAPTTLDKYIEQEVDKAKTAAVIYKGAITPASSKAAAVVPYTNPTNGDMYKINAEGYVLLTTGSDATAVAVKAGDTVICKGTADGVTTWDLIPSGDEAETSIDGQYGAITFTGTGVSHNGLVYTFTDTTYSAFVGFGPGKIPAVGLVPAPNAANQYLNSDGTWKQIAYSELSGKPDIYNAIHTIAIGAAGTEGTNFQKATNTFSANASTDVTTYIPLATQTASGVIWGAVKGNNTTTVPASAGWQAAQIIDGVVKFYNNKYSFQNLTISGKDSSATAKSITFDSQTAKELAFGNNLTVAVENNKITVAGTPNTWRPVYAYNANSVAGSALDSAAPDTGFKSLCFGSEFMYVDVDSDSNMPGSEIHLAWAEVDDSGNVTYHV